MIVWLGDWGAPEKIHPNLEPGWVGFGWTFPARNELICTSFETDELDENMFQKRCAFVSTSKYAVISVVISELHALFLPGHTENSTPPSLMNGQRVLLSWEQQESTEDLLQTSNIQPCLWVYDIHISDTEFSSVLWIFHIGVSPSWCSFRLWWLNFNLPPFWVARVANACNSSRVP